MCAASGRNGLVFFFVRISVSFVCSMLFFVCVCVGWLVVFFGYFSGRRCCVGSERGRLSRGAQTAAAAASASSSSSSVTVLLTDCVILSLRSRRWKNK